MSEPVSFRVRGRPAPKGSRNVRVTKKGHAYTYPASKYEEPWIQNVAAAARYVLHGQTMLDPPYRVELEFLQAPTKNPGRKLRQDWPSRNDLDKLIRATMDGLVRGEAIEDDRHVVEIASRKRFVEDASDEGVLVTISTIAVDNGSV